MAALRNQRASSTPQLRVGDEMVFQLKTQNGISKDLLLPTCSSGRGTSASHVHSPRCLRTERGGVGGGGGGGGDRGRETVRERENESE